MLTFVLKRVAFAILTLVVATVLAFVLVHLSGSTPGAVALGQSGTPEQVYEYNVEIGWYDPWVTQYLGWVSQVFQGNLGTTFSGQSVNEILVRTFPNTLRLALLAILIQLVLGVLVGLISGLRKGSLFDHGALLVSLVLISLPVFVLAFVAQFFLGIQLGIFRATVGPGAPWGDLILPAIVLAALNFAYVVRLTRTSTIDTSQQDFVRMAYGKGLSGRRVIPVHVLRNSLIPVTTNLAADFGILIVGATVTEGIFNVPGVGNELFKAINRHDSPEIVSIVTILVVIYVLVNLLIDLLYGVLDPRIRYVK